MKIKIKAENKRFVIPAPVSLARIFIRMLPKKEISKEDKKIIIKLLKVLKKELKEYKGLEIVNVKSASGESIIVEA